MITDTRERRRFIEYVISDCLLEDSVMWIKDNLSPDDVFSKSQLMEWADTEGLVSKEDTE